MGWHGKVVAVGPGLRDVEGKLVPVCVKEGDIVLLAEYGGTEVKLDDKKSHFVHRIITVSTCSIHFDFFERSLFQVLSNHLDKSTIGGNKLKPLTLGIFKAFKTVIITTNAFPAQNPQRIIWIKVQAKIHTISIFARDLKPRIPYRIPRAFS
ncbi:hypothetical protein LXL04_000213 [Taraxacum kok-saghyz]